MKEFSQMKSALNLTQVRGILSLSFSFLISSALAAKVSVEVRPLDPAPSFAAAQMSQELKMPGALSKAVSKEGFQVLSQILSPNSSNYVVELFNYKTNEARRFTARLGSQSNGKMDVLKHAPMLTEAETERAFAIVSKSEAFSEGLKRKEIELYESMPGIISNTDKNSEFFGRSVTVGLRPLNSKFKHEIVAVNLRTEKIQRFETLAPESCRETTSAFCGYPNGSGPRSRRGDAGTAEVIIRDSENTEVWKFNVTRPTASSASNGSGMDLHNLTYKGRLIFNQFHMPLQNVLYDNNACGPYRDWQHTENPFQATGTNLAPGILLASKNPQSIVDRKADGGNFVGVAIFTDPKTQVTRLVTQMSAGWYRYVQEFFFHLDGTFEPRWTFTATNSSCVCKAHRHHIYFRMDVGLGDETNNTFQVRELGSESQEWKDITEEQKLFRTAGQSWRILNSDLKTAIEITAGPNDETAQGDPYAKGDIWALVKKDSEIDDGEQRRDTSVNLDAFIGPEVLTGQDLVFWYGSHYRHDTGESEAHSRMVGPTIRVLSNL
jgi:hypothetical protein